MTRAYPWEPSEVGSWPYSMHFTRLERLAKDEHLSLVSPFVSYVFTRLHFLTNSPNKLECYIKQSWKDLLGTNALTYWTHL